MANNGFKVLDIDMHVEEPLDLWERYTDPEFRHLAPRGGCPQGESAGVLLVGPDGEPWGLSPEAAEGFRLVRTGRSVVHHQEATAPYREKGFTPEAQIEAMEEEGIDVAVLYPTRGLTALGLSTMEPRLAAALARAYNNWLYDFCQGHPGRLYGAGMISPFDMEDAVSEARRCREELGFRGIFLRPNQYQGRNLDDPYYEPLWSVLEELDMPLGLHEGTGTSMKQTGDQFGSNNMMVHTFSHPVEQMMAAAALAARGVLERHPRLRIASLEAGCSWLPFFLWRLDEHWERLGDVFSPGVKMAPSEYIKRQWFTSVEPDEGPVGYVIDYMGNDRLVLSTDFPHSDSKFPHAIETFLQLPITEEDKRKILWDNCAEYYKMR